MKVIVTPKNHSDWDMDISQYHPEFKKVLKAHLSINEYLDDQLAGNLDWAGRYATWLNFFGIHHETKNGWWSKRAVMPENIDLFIEENKSESDEFHEKIGRAIDTIAKVKRAGKFVSQKETVREVVEAIIGEKL